MTQKVTRGDETGYFREGWERYLRARVKRPHDLCGLLRQSGQPLRQFELESIKRELERLDAESQAESWQAAQARYKAVDNTWGLPWLTLVVGSGCVTELAGADERQALQKALREILRISSQWGALRNGEFAGDVVHEYACALLSLRFDGIMQEDPPTPDEPVPSDDLRLAARALLAAALMQRFVLVASSVSSSYILGKSDEVVLIDGSPDSLRLGETLVADLRQTLREFSRAVTPPSDLAFLCRFVDSVNSRLGDVPPTANISDARLLAEIAWQLFARDLPHYAGWHDMLDLLTMKTEAVDQDKKRPYLTDLELTREFLTAALADKTRNSWRLSWELEEKGGGGRMYDLVAAVVDAQAEMARDRNKIGQYEVPAATVLVTSLDLEVEMALFRAQWRRRQGHDASPEAGAAVLTDERLDRHHERESGFIVVAPFEVVAQIEGADHAYLTWWWTEVTTEEVEAVGAGLAEPIGVLGGDRPWALATHRLFASGELDRRRLPVVVRLVGCPLLKPFGHLELPLAKSMPDDVHLPEPWRSIRVLLPGTKPAERFDIYPSLLLDENTAVHQALAELRARERRPLDESDGSGEHDGVGLPEALLEGTTHFFRFWMLLGVQLSDEAVRMRVAATMTASDAHCESGRRGPTQTGVALNLWSTAGERDVLHWQGFDVVKDRSESARTDLEHYLVHLRARPEWYTGCTCAERK